MTAVDADVEAKRVVVTSEDGAGAATAEAMLAALKKWCVLRLFACCVGFVRFGVGRWMCRCVAAFFLVLIV